jgi:pimeloyl-ACP methyl ester carboxylesterase
VSNCFRFTPSGDGLKCEVSWEGKDFRNISCSFLSVDQTTRLTTSANRGFGSPHGAPYPENQRRRSDRGNLLEVVPAIGTRPRGSAQAKGAVYFFGGHHAARPTPMDEDIVQPHIISMSRKGWDVFRANVPMNLRTGRARLLVASEMNDLAATARRQGYERVVFMGQSFGAWNILLAAKQGDFDAFIAFGPACCGLPSDYPSQILPQWEQLMRRIPDMALASTVPGQIFIFDQDPYFTLPQLRRLTTSDFGDVGVVYAPEGFTGHGSAWLDEFDALYGDCIEDYMSSPNAGLKCS